LNRFLLVALLLILLIGGVASAQDDRSITWQQWDVTIDNLDTSANRFDVVETTMIEFSGTFRFGQRVISWDQLDRISSVRINSTVLAA